MKTKAVAFLLAVIITFGIAACSGNTASPESSMPSSGIPETSAKIPAQTTKDTTIPPATKAPAEETLPMPTEPGADAAVTRILAIGNENCRDILFYAGDLAALGGKNLSLAYLEKTNGSIRNLSRVLECGAEEYRLNSWDISAGIWKDSGTTDVVTVLSSEPWDYILLTQGILVSGFPGTYNCDLEYVTDVIRDKAAGAKIYWSMNWSFGRTLTNSSFGSGYSTYYSSDTAVMYNAIVDCLTRFIAGKEARYGACFDGFIPIGAAIQNLRDTNLAPELDGANLSFKAGRLTAAWTLLGTLFPELDLRKAVTTKELESLLIMKDGSTIDVSAYENDTASLEIIRQAAVSVITGGLPRKCSVKKPLTQDKKDVYTTAQVVAPLKLHFPDVKTLSDGRMVIGAYENVYHVPKRSSDTSNKDEQMMEGPGRLVFYTGSADGKTWHYDEPILVVDQDQMEKWGLIEVSHRYERLKNGTSQYLIFADPRDPNLAVTFIDVNNDGKKEEVLLITFWNREYKKDATNANRCYMLWGYEENGSWIWSTPQKLLRSNGNNLVKRGDIAVFSDDEILIPCYSSPACLRMKWQAQEGKWQLLKDTMIPNLAPSESKNFNEVSLAAPDPAGNTVYAFVRESGEVLKSENRGASWTLVGNEPGLIHQPGFAVLGEERIFATWARTSSPRWVYGKVFYIGEDYSWESTKSNLLYQNHNDSSKDMADPSCTVMADGRVFVAAYDTSVRSIVGVIADPAEQRWQPGN